MSSMATKSLLLLAVIATLAAPVRAADSNENPYAPKATERAQARENTMRELPPA
jgi:hypothetical protein